jgi:hypothetical protein
MRSLRFILIPPLLSLGMLAGMVAEKRTHVKPEDVEPYHARAREAIESLPWRMGTWIGMEQPVPEAAIKMLRPNVIVNRQYVDTTLDPAKRDRRATLLIVHCRDSRDMVGHYPPNCYPAHGMTTLSTTPQHWQVEHLNIHGTEYIFEQTVQDRTHRIAIYNFLIVPGVGIVPDMRGVHKAASDYQRRYFGVAQFQILMDGQMPPEERKEVLATFIAENIPIIETLMSGGNQ